MKTKYDAKKTLEGELAVIQVTDVLDKSLFLECVVKGVYNLLWKADGIVDIKILQLKGE